MGGGKVRLHLQPADPDEWQVIGVLGSGPGEMVRVRACPLQAACEGLTGAMESVQQTLVQYSRHSSKWTTLLLSYD